MDIELNNAILELFNRFVNDLDDKMYFAMQNKGDVHLQAPEFIIRILCDAYSYSFGRMPETTADGYYLFQGLKIEPTYEMAIIMFHKEYPLYRQDWMLKKIPLDPPVTLKEEWYSKTIVQIK